MKIMTIPITPTLGVITSWMCSGPMVHAMKRYPSARVEGSIKTIPAILEGIRSAAKERRATKLPPTRKEVMSCR